MIPKQVPAGRPQKRKPDRQSCTILTVRVLALEPLYISVSMLNPPTPNTDPRACTRTCSVLLHVSCFLLQKIRASGNLSARANMIYRGPPHTYATSQYEQLTPTTATNHTQTPRKRLADALRPIAESPPDQCPRLVVDD
jgi:hypothetical protein